MCVGTRAVGKIGLFISLKYLEFMQSIIMLKNMGNITNAQDENKYNLFLFLIFGSLVLQSRKFEFIIICNLKKIFLIELVHNLFVNKKTNKLGTFNPSKIY